MSRILDAVNNRSVRANAAARPQGGVVITIDPVQHLMWLDCSERDEHDAIIPFGPLSYNPATPPQLGNRVSIPYIGDGPHSPAIQGSAVGGALPASTVEVNASNLVQSLQQYPVGSTSPMAGAIQIAGDGDTIEVTQDGSAKRLTVAMVDVGTAGTYGDATHVAQITTDGVGRVTAASAVAIFGAPQVANGIVATQLPTVDSATNIVLFGAFNSTNAQAATAGSYWEWQVSFDSGTTWQAAGVVNAISGSCAVTWTTLTSGTVQAQARLKGQNGTTTDWYTTTDVTYTPAASGSRGTGWFQGSGAPGTVAGAISGDLYLRTSNGDVYQYSGSSWGSPVGNLKGATGSTGATGAPGAAGTNGADGATPLTTTTGSWTQPATNSTATVTVTSAGAFAVGQYVQIVNGSNVATCQITAKSGSTLTLKALGYTGDTSASTVYASGSTLALTGQQGVAGSSASFGAASDPAGVYTYLDSGQTTNIAAFEAYHTSAPNASMGAEYEWQFATDGAGRSWGSSRYGGRLVEYSLTSGTVRARVRLRGADGTTGEWKPGMTGTSDLTYAAPSGGGAGIQTDSSPSGSYSLTTSYAKVSCGQNIQATLPSGPAFVGFLASVTAGASANDSIYLKLYNETDSVDVPGSEILLSDLGASAQRFVSLYAKGVNYAANKTIALYAKNATAARGTINGPQTALEFTSLVSLTINSTAPTLAASAGNTQVTLTVSNSLYTTFNVYRGTSSGGQSATPVATGVTSPYIDTGLTNGTTYYYYVKPVTASGPGTSSNEVSATPTIYPISTTNLEFWLKADAINGLSDGASLSSWTDSSPNSTSVTQSTGANQPVYKTNILNGMAVARFTGTAPPFLRVAERSSMRSQNITFFAVVKRNSASSGYPPVLARPWYTNGAVSDPYASWQFLVANNGTASIDMQTANGPGGSVHRQATSSLSNNTWYMLTWRFAAGTVTMRVNGSAVSTSGSNVSTIGYSQTGQSILLGGTGFETSGQGFDGDIAEVAFYSRNVNDTECGTIESYMRTKWNF